MPSFFIIGAVKINLKNVIFKYADFYKFIYNTMRDLGYFIEEKKYSHNPKDAKKSYVDFYWACLKNIDDYNRFKIEVDTKFTDLEPITIVKDKKKEKMDKGEGIIKFTATLITDYDSKWEDNPIMNFVKAIFDNLFEKSSVNQYKDDLQKELYNLENEAKSYFNIQRTL